jgi:hypothetical protein
MRGSFSITESATEQVRGKGFADVSATISNDSRVLTVTATRDGVPFTFEGATIGEVVTQADTARN